MEGVGMHVSERWGGCLRELVNYAQYVVSHFQTLKLRLLRGLSCISVQLKVNGCGERQRICSPSGCACKSCYAGVL
jgi:hypothetical protein